jgi:hypothetical protein
MLEGKIVQVRKQTLGGHRNETNYACNLLARSRWIYVSL